MYALFYCVIRMVHWLWPKEVLKRGFTDIEVSSDDFVGEVTSVSNKMEYLIVES